MSDSDDDWDADDKILEIPKLATKGGAETKGQEILAKAKAPDTSKFAGEDEDAEQKPAWDKNVPKSEKKKEEVKKYDEKRGTQLVDEGTPLDDPAAEKERRQRLIEQADLQATKELFGAGEVEPETLQPKTAKDFEELARAVVAKFVAPHLKSSHLKILAKALVRGTAQHLTSSTIRDVESALAGVKSDKLREEKASAATTKKATGKRASVNVGKQGGSAGLDDYQYTDDLPDDTDFM